MNRRGDALRGVTLAVVVAGLALAWAVDGSGNALAATLLAASLGAGNMGRRLAALALYLGGGAVVGGAAGYALATVATTGMTTLGLGFGLALGGAAGLAVTLLGEGDEESGGEALTVETTTETAPDPQPADLFTRHPDPLVYYENEGHGPVVRAANPAFEEVFGVGSGTVTGAPLGEALMVVEGTESLVAAVRAGDPLDRVVACETDAGPKKYRLRTVAVDEVTRGYVVYTPAEE